jgi:hypothetical protein
MVRIYRKDIELLEKHKIKKPPTLRIELELKDCFASGFWDEFVLNGFQYALRIASSHIEHMTSFKCIPDDSVDIPSGDNITPSSLFSRFYQFIWAYGNFQHLLKKMPFDLDGITSKRYFNMSRSAKSRIGQLERELDSLSSDDWIALTCQLSDALDDIQFWD